MSIGGVQGSGLLGLGFLGLGLGVAVGVGVGVGLDKSGLGLRLLRQLGFELVRVRVRVEKPVSPLDEWPWKWQVNGHRNSNCPYTLARHLFSHHSQVRVRGGHSTSRPTMHYHTTNAHKTHH